MTSSFSFGAMISELGQRRRRLDKMLGDRGKGFFELFVLGGLVLGSAGLFLYPWMFAAAWWGMAAPALFISLYIVLEVRRQSALAAGGDEEKVRARYRRLTFWTTLACVLLGYAAFAWGVYSDPRPPPEAPGWEPPADAVPAELHPAS